MTQPVRPTADPCCSPSKEEFAEAIPRPVSAAQPRDRAPTSDGPFTSWVSLPGGDFLMGSAEELYPADHEGPVRPASVKGFAISPTTVTNSEFAQFVFETGHGTTAEQQGWSFVFGGLLNADHPPTRGVADAPWWRQVYGARWDQPEGPGSDVHGREDHPVVHVSWVDARAYCKWAGGRLPTEPEWEYAARGGLEQQRFPWGDELTPAGKHMMNVFEGDFPTRNVAANWRTGTAPVGAFSPNGYGLYNMTGNVWEWTADRFGSSRPAHRAMRGGSYLCHASYCRRYRCAGRSSNTADSFSGNIGFRLARDPQSTTEQF
jgi:formylglycine-generating enzyme